jgi:LmbE family N-acetylglucosaminyl deacetylase
MKMWEGLIGSGRSILVVGAHADDIEIGCGGTLIRLMAEVDTANLDWVVLAAPGERGEEARASARVLAGAANVSVLDFRERYFPHLPELKEWFDDLATAIEPDLVLCPWKGDAHQDHATIGRLAHETFRDALILQYEIPKRDGDLGRPTVYVPLTEEHIRRKSDHLIEYFPSQLHRPWFQPDTFRSLARLRGVEAGAPFAEAFHCDRMVLR